LTLAPRKRYGPAPTQAALSFPGGGGWRFEYFTVGIDSNPLQDTLTTFIATPFSQ